MTNNMDESQKHVDRKKSHKILCIIWLQILEQERLSYGDINQNKNGGVLIAKICEGTFWGLELFLSLNGMVATQAYASNYTLKSVYFENIIYNSIRLIFLKRCLIFFHWRKAVSLLIAPELGLLFSTLVLPGNGTREYITPSFIFLWLLRKKYSIFLARVS